MPTGPGRRAAIVLVLLAASCGSSDTDVQSRPRQPPGGWRELPPAPATASSEGAPIWTGDELIVWGGRVQGSSDTTRELRTGVAYRP